jgi:uncharacterized SAM-binding protein YcdF (DUF218 family)
VHLGPEVRHHSPLHCSITTLKRLFIRGALVLAALVLVGLYPVSRLGAWLVVEDPLQKADGIVVLGGTMYERQLEGVDLFKAGYAPRIYVLREIQDWGEVELIRRGVSYIRPVEIQIDTMVKLGVPREAIGILEAANSTAQEADHVHALVTAERLSRVIVVTSKQHTRRARLVMNRRMRGTGAGVIIRASRYDHEDVERWWGNRGTLRFTLFETQRLFAYWIGLAD